MSGDSEFTMGHGGGGNFPIGGGTRSIDCEEFDNCSKGEIIFVMHSCQKSLLIRTIFKSK